MQGEKNPLHQHLHQQKRIQFKRWMANQYPTLTRFLDIGEISRRIAWCPVMTTFYDIPAELLIPALAERIAATDGIDTPDWAGFVKTAVSRERPPSQENWWFLRTAALLRKVAREGPIGVTHLSQAYGGIKDNGAMPNTPGVAGRHIIRTSLQQLESAGLVEKVPTKTVETEEGEVQLYAGRRITSAGQKMLNEIAHDCRTAANEQFPGLDKY
jgi:small subunit ribosomal protein S19e